MKFFFCIAMLLHIMNVAATSVSQQTDYYGITTFEGLPSNTVGAIKKDSLGFIWIGTKDGICRFDGCGVKNYPVLKGEDIWSIEELDSDTLLIGAVSGLLYFSRKGNTALKLKLSGTVAKTVKKVNNRQFFVGTESGLYLVSDHIPRQISLETGLAAPCNHITSILKEDKNVYWISTMDGLVRIDIRTMSPVIYRMQEEDMENSNRFICLTRIGNQIYLGSFNKGVFRFDISSKKFDKVNGFNHNLIMTIWVENDRLFVGTNGQGLKVMSLKDGHIETFSHKGKNRHSLSSNTVTTFLYDDGIQWVGTQFGGINYTPLDSAKFSYYSWSDFYSPEYRVRSFYMFPDGSRLIGTRSGLFYISEKEGILRHYEQEKHSSGLRSDIIPFIGEIQGRVLIATYGGGMHLFEKQTLQLRNLSAEEPFLYGCFFHFVQDRSGNLWIASQEGLYYSTPEGHIIRKYDTENSPLTTDAVYYLYADCFNRLWIGSKTGLFLLDIRTGKMQSDCFDMPIKGEVRYIMEDGRKSFWICTDNGLYKLGQDLKVLEHFTTEDFLPSNQVYSIYENGGCYWIAAGEEVVKYYPKNNLHYTYQRMDGLSGQIFNPSVVASNDSVIWWANEGGLIYTSEKNKKVHASQNVQIKMPVVTTCSASGIEYDIPYTDQLNGIILPYSNNNIHFKYSYLDYSLPYTNVYEYRLEGYDTSWKQQTGIGEAVYSNLPSGHYIFRLRKPGTEDDVQIPVVVRRSYIFPVVVSLVIILIIILVVYFSQYIWKLKKRMAKERNILGDVLQLEKNRKTVLQNTEMEVLRERLLAFMENDKPYLNAKLTLSDVAGNLECAELELSQLLNNNMGVNFANFINVYRINEVKSRINQENLSRYTLKALSEQCGFNSKTTFYRVFKNVTGMTPFEYCQKHNLTIAE